MSVLPQAQARRLVLLCWILVAIFYFYLSYDYIRTSMNNEEFGEYVKYVVQLAGSENRPAKEVRTLLVIRAQDLALPISDENISIGGGGQALEVTVAYNVDIDFPIFRRGFYVKRFEHRVSYKSPR